MFSLGNNIACLEWGSGGSTHYFPDRLHERDIRFLWHSLEHNPEWYDRVKQNLPLRVQLHLLGQERGPAGINLDEYVTWPRKKLHTYDFILVDGRQRGRCLVEARFLLKPGGMAFLHDAQRKRYHWALPLFPVSEFLSQTLWRGSIARTRA